MDLWYFFLHRAIDVVKENGIVGFITNSYFMKSFGASKLIARIKNEAVLDKVVDFGDIKIFGDVSGKHMIHIYTKKISNGSEETCYIKVDEKTPMEFIDDVQCVYKPYASVISADHKMDFSIGEDIEFKNCVLLRDLFYVSQGVVEAPAKISKKAALLSPSNIKNGDGVFVVSKKELDELHLNTSESATIKKYLNANNIGKYSIDFEDEYLIYSDGEVKNKIGAGEYPHLKSHLDKYQKYITSSNKPYGLHRPREKDYFENPKLICKGMFLKPDFCFDDERYYVGFSFSAIIQKEKAYSLKYLLGILNSSLAENWFNRYGKKRGVGVDIGVLVFRQFPVRTATPAEQEPIIKLVDTILMLNKELRATSKGSSHYESINGEIKRTDEAINELVYQLYKLSAEEIRMIEE